MINFRLGEDELTLNVMDKFLSGEVKTIVSSSKRKDLEKVRQFVEDHIDSEHTYYGINTGFGRLANVKISQDQLEELQENLIRSHAFGVGPELDQDLVRAMMLLRAHVLAMGYSGVSLGVLDLLVLMIDRGVIPVVPSKGSVGACGDLVPLAFLALTMIGEGEACYRDKRGHSVEILKEAGLAPLKLRAKDGLSLINGTQAMTALAAKAVLKARGLIKLLDVAAALSVEGLRGSASPFDPDVNRIRVQEGQQKAAQMVRRLLNESKIIASHVQCKRVQDPYSLRCVPQVHGAVRDAVHYVKDVVLREMNSCTDNPLVFVTHGKIVSGGNFHGEPIAIAMDTLSIAMAELGSISERRIEQLTNPKSGDLPVMYLTPKPGLNSGYMVPHVVSSSLVSENKTLAHPASVDTIPTFAGQEDHVSMGMWASRKALKIIENVEWIAVIELACASQAIDLHEEKLAPGVGTSIAYKFVREHVGFMETDRWLKPEMNNLHKAVTAGKLTEQVGNSIGEWMI